MVASCKNKAIQPFCLPLQLPWYLPYVPKYVCAFFSLSLSKAKLRA
jgi:hypothetical protein